jgi:acetylglutamate kinase
MSKEEPLMEAFAGKAFVVRVDRTAARERDSTLIDDLAFLAREQVRPIVVAPDPLTAKRLVRTINRSGNVAVGLSGADAAMLPRAPGGLGNVQTGILQTLTTAGYIPVVEPTAFSAFGDDVAIDADEVARAIAAATAAIRAIFFHALGGVPDPQTEALISELTPAEALAIAENPRVPADLRAAIRAAALGVRAGVSAAQIVDGRVANALVIELLTAQHLGTQVTGSIYRGAA